jgi:hypothetical protein
MNKVP